MAEKFLGPSFDIHLGGLDLVFPHHENERAQSQAAGREFARIWMHNGLLRLDREKMSKSVGNIAPLKDVLERWGRETVLLFFMTGHWSKPIDFSDDVMEQAAARVERFRDVFRSPSQTGGDWGSFAAAWEWCSNGRIRFPNPFSKMSPMAPKSTGLTCRSRRSLRKVCAARRCGTK